MILKAVHINSYNMKVGFGLIKMNSVMRFISLILVCLPLVVHSDVEVTNTGPGNTLCMYYGDLDDFCNFTTVNPDQIPEDCSSIVFYSGEVDVLTYKVAMSLESQIENLKALLASKKQVLLYYSPIEKVDWLTSLRCNTEDGGEHANCEMEGIKAFFVEYPGIAGLVIDYIDPGLFPADFPCPTENFKVYLEVMRKAFPGLIIGFEFQAKKLIDFNFNPVGQWFDFSTLDALIDFYIVNTFATRKCTPDLLQTKGAGGYPITGNATYTLEKAMGYAAQVNIPKDKCIIQFSTGSVPTGDDLDPCAMSNTMSCLTPSDFCETCSESLASYIAKGQYVKENAKGFMIDCIDADDPGGVCCCPSGPFPAFHALVNGFKGVTTPESCPKYDAFST